MAATPPERGRRRVAVTGVGAVTPLGCGAASLLSRWAAGVCAIDDGAGRCDSFDPGSVLSLREARRTDRFTQFTLAAAQEAATQAGWEDGPPVEPERAGCVIGTGFGGIGTIETQGDVFRDRGPRQISPAAISSMMPNGAAVSIAIRLGLRGSAHSVGSACAAGGDAIGTAVRAIRGGHADAMLAGGADACLTPLAIAATERAGALSPTGRSLPFDARRDGFVLGEGAAVLVLEDLEAALERGATVLGEVLGYGSTVDGYHLTAPDPGGRCARRAVELALEDAGVTPADVDYVNAHGTGTRLNDAAETLALEGALGEDARRIPVSSLKSSIGHLCGGAGAAEAVVTLQALRERVVPPTLGLEEPDPELRLDYVPGQARALEPGDPARAVALSTSFGFGGHNAVLCLAA